MNQCQQSIVIFFTTVLIGSLLLVAPAAAEETNSTDSTVAGVSIEVEEISDSEYRLTYEISPGDGTHFVSPPDDQIPIESMENLERTSQPGVLRITDVSDSATLILRVKFDALGRYGGSTRDSAVFESDVELYSNGEWTPVEYTGVEGLSVSVSGEDGLETHLGQGSIYVGDDLVVETTELPDGRQVTIVGTERQLGDGEIVNHALSRLSAISQMVNLTTEYDITVAVSSGVSRAYVRYTPSGDTVWQGTMFVSPSDVTNGHTLAHEYIHLQQEMHFSSEMEWFLEGSAEYFATQAMQNQDGVESYFRSGIEPGSESGDTLANRDTWENQWVEYEKGAIVAMLLDYQLQQHGSSLAAVMQEVNRRNFSEPVTYDEFRQIIVDRTDLTVGGHLDRWIQEPDTLNVPDSAYRFLLAQHAENHVESSGDLTPETPMILNVDGNLSPSELVLTGHQRVYERYVSSDSDERREIADLQPTGGIPRISSQLTKL